MKVLSLSTIFSQKTERMRGKDLNKFEISNYEKEKIFFLAKWTPDRKNYFPPSVNVSIATLLLCHHHCKVQKEVKGMGFIGKCPRVIILVIAGELGRLFFKFPKSFESKSPLSSVYEKRGNCILN